MSDTLDEARDRSEGEGQSARYREGADNQASLPLSAGAPLLRCMRERTLYIPSQPVHSESSEAEPRLWKLSVVSPADWVSTDEAENGLQRSVRALSEMSSRAIGISGD